MEFKEFIIKKAGVETGFFNIQNSIKINYLKSLRFENPLFQELPHY